MNDTLVHVDLFTGLGGWKAPFEESDRWTSVGVDIRDDLNADVVGDVRHLPIDCDPSLVTLSPPCVAFTRWELPWYDDDDPSLELVRAGLDAVDSLNPDFWIMENVVGLSKYWKPSRKNLGPFHFWGEFPPWDAQYVWKHQNQQPKEQRSELAAQIPYHYAYALMKACEVYL